MNQEPKATEATAQLKLEELFAKMERPLTNVLYRWVWDREEVRDLVQDAFVKLWAMNEQIDWQRAEALVYKIALNLAASRRRKHKLWRMVPFLDRTFATRTDAQQTLENHEQEEALRSAIDALPEKQRQVLTLCVFSDLGYAAISEMLNISEGTVASRRNTAVHSVRQAMNRWQANK